MNGDTYAGQFFENELHGIGTYTAANGERITGRFKNGEFVAGDTAGSNKLSLDVFEAKDRRDLLGATAAADAAGATDTTVYMIHERKKLQQLYMQQEQHQQQQQQQHQFHEPSQDPPDGSVQLVCAYQADNPLNSSSFPSPTESARQVAVHTPSYKCA
jgi:hypothetical protein